MIDTQNKRITHAVPEFRFSDVCISSSFPIKAASMTIPSEYMYSIIKVIRTIICPIMFEFGDQVRINSFFRDKDLNKAVGGSSTSDHLYGAAIDISVDTLSSWALFLLMRVNEDTRQLIYYPKSRHFHASVQHPYKKFKQDYYVKEADGYRHFSRLDFSNYLRDAK
jgi:hypothetical protein